MLKSPLLWSPETPTLYNLIVRIRDNEGNVVDGYRRRIGIRSVEFKGKDGFWLNGKTLSKPTDWRQPPSGFCRSRQCRCQQHSLARR